MVRHLVAAAILSTVFMPTRASAFVAIDAGVVHDVGVPWGRSVYGLVEVPTRAGPDSIAWQNGGDKTVRAVGYGADYHTFLARLTPDGEERWRVDIANAGTARAVGPDTLVVSNTYEPFTSRLQRIDANGETLWEVAEVGSQWSSFAAGEDGSGFLITNTPGMQDWELVRRDAQGVLAWSAPLAMMPAIDTLGTPEWPTIIPARNGGAFVQGHRAFGGGSFMAVERYDPDGARRWTRDFGAIYWGRGNSALAEDEVGNVFFAYGGGSSVLVYKLTAGGALRRATTLEQEDMGFSGQQLISARGGGALLVTSMGVHRIDVNGDVAWSYAAEDCALGCEPQAIVERDDGHLFALWSVRLSEALPIGTTAFRVVELDADGSALDAYTSSPPQLLDRPTALRIDGSSVEVMMQSICDDEIERIRFVRLEQENFFADGFDGLR